VRGASAPVVPHSRTPALRNVDVVAGVDDIYCGLSTKVETYDNGDVLPAYVHYLEEQWKS